MYSVLCKISNSLFSRKQWIRCFVLAVLYLGDILAFALSSLHLLYHCGAALRACGVVTIRRAFRYTGSVPDNLFIYPSLIIVSQCPCELQATDNTTESS